MKTHTAKRTNAIKSGNKRRSLGTAAEDASFPIPSPTMDLPESYVSTLRELKQRIAEERLRTILSANAAMVLLYWDVGQVILRRQQAEGWGTQVIDRLSADLRKAFPDMRGLSPRNLKYMRAFTAAWPERSFVQQTAAQIPWFHNCLILDKINNREARIWYMRATLENGWSRNILALQIENSLHERQGKATHNFLATLPPSDSDMATQIFKDPYLFDFLGTADPRREREVEQALIDNIQSFLLELGMGFAFIGRQVHLEVGDQDFYIDLLFYHVKLHCYVIIELKAGHFEPGFLGQLNMYLSAADDLLRQPEDKPTIGLLLCRSKTKLIVEYALRGIEKPIGVAQWETELVKALPEELRGSLPTIEEIEALFKEDHPPDRTDMD